MHASVREIKHAHSMILHASSLHNPTSHDHCRTYCVGGIHFVRRTDENRTPVYGGMCIRKCHSTAHGRGGGQADSEGGGGRAQAGGGRTGAPAPAPVSPGPVSPGPSHPGGVVCDGRRFPIPPTHVGKPTSTAYPHVCFLVDPIYVSSRVSAGNIDRIHAENSLIVITSMSKTTITKPLC